MVDGNAPGRDRRTRSQVAGPRGQALAITQTAGYGVLYHAFSVFIPPMARDLRTGVARLTGAITVSVLVSALFAPLVGRRLDRHGGRALMTAGSLLGGLAVLAWSQMRTVTQLYLVCAVLGIASERSPGGLRSVRAGAGAGGRAARRADLRPAVRRRRKLTERRSTTT
ncbi:hypothetical protein [Nonomuraea sp. NPDC052265]|uniref:hypothetical protein n=1 Tax=Nonomuraea sp. NPDC052265 TaxID=3364374 RepID=UPI0037CA3E0A